MNEAERIFSRFPDFIKEYIYNHGWSELREIQLDAARVIFESDANLLLSGSTASGKTEAAFFPIISDILANGDFEKSMCNYKQKRRCFGCENCGYHCSCL